jgi:hypothetical protein
MRALIAGGGIGGLTLALSLHERGIPCTVFEAAREVRELGVGVNILPHAVRELSALGLLPALDAAAVRTRELRYLNRFGQEIWVEARGMLAGHDVPQFSIHRGRLHASSGAPRANGSAPGRSVRGAASSRSSRTRRASPPGSRTARPSAAMSWSARTASTRPCAPHCTRTTAASVGTASKFGAARWSGPASAAATP